jgi:hypothetical protein
MREIIAWRDNHPDEAPQQIETYATEVESDEVDPETAAESSSNGLSTLEKLRADAERGRNGSGSRGGAD